MTVREYIEKCKKELEAQKYRNVQYVRSQPITFERQSYGFILFDRNVIPMDAQIDEQRAKPTAWGEKIAGVEITFSCIKPRCRKSSREYFRTPLAEVIEKAS